MHYTDYDDFVNSKCYCSAWVATAIVGSAVVGGAVQAYSANKAADTQREAAQLASQTQLTGQREANALLDKQYNQTRADLSPYRDLGGYGIDQLKANSNLMLPIDVPQEMLDLQKPITIDQATLENLPGYQFARTQGLKAVQNSAAARGLGTSGAALKGAANFSQGLADQNWQNYFNAEMQNRQSAFGRYDTTLGRQIQQRQSAFDRLKGLIDTGGAAAAGTAALGQKTATSQAGNITSAASGVASNTIGAGNAGAAAINKTGDAISGAISSLPVAAYSYNKGLYGSGGQSFNGVSQIPSEAFMNNKWGW